MILYSPTISPRIRYMANWLGNYLFARPMPVCNDESVLDGSGPIINYSAEPLGFASLHIIPCGLLWQTTITPCNVGVLPKNGLPHLSINGQPDLLAAIFYLLSRYEEYLPHEKDLYGRYAHTNSIAFTEGFLQRPLVDEWMTDLKRELKELFPQLVFAERQVEYQPTYDVDIAWSYKHKGWLRNTGGLLKDMATGAFKKIRERLSVLAGTKTDPFDVFDALDDLHEQNGLSAKYFILLGARPRGYDKNIDPKNKGYQALVRRLSSHYATGIHLSWQSATSPVVKEQEIQMLETITGERPVTNRMHYINFHLPQTFRELIACGITKDYSMGYGSINGFRASVCTPFYWYDLEAEEETTLEIVPYCYMEANSIFEQLDDTEKALVELQHYHDIIQKHRGKMVTIFHNHLIANTSEGKPWMQMYRDFLQHNFS